MKQKRYMINGDGLTISQGLGVHRFAAEILKHLDAMLTDQNFEAWVVIPSNREIPYQYQNIQVKKTGVQKNNTISKNLWQQLSFPAFVKRNHGIGIDLTLAIPVWGCRYIAIHDCIVEKYPENFPSKRGRIMRRFYIWRVNRIRKKCEILTVSENSKKDIEELYHIPAERIHVIGNGWDHMQKVQPQEEILKKLKLQEKGYFFSLGSKYRHKNHAWIVQAAAANPQYTFVVSGSSFEPETELAHARKNPDNLIFTGYLEDAQFKALMQHCKAFIQPSFYEGFGIPPLEALSCGARVIAANASCFPEIYENSVCYLNPADGNVDIDKLLKQKTESPEAVLAKYTWENAAKRLAAVLMDGYKK